MRIVLLLGPVGSGKLAMARQMFSKLPLLDQNTSIEATWVWQEARCIEYGSPIEQVPYRAPHYTVSEAGLVGSATRTFGERRICPGEVSLAHGGCLVLHEIQEFRMSCIESLGRVLKDGRSVLDGVYLPAKPALVVVCADLCGCGWLGGSRPCICKPDAVARWNERLLSYCEILGVTEIVPVHYPSARTSDGAHRIGDRR